MRIVAGEFKGRSLRAPAGERTRPTADKVREAVFSMLGPIEGTRVLDLFAGSGALAIEALSRGAASAVLVDVAAPAVAAIAKNLEPLEVDATVRRRDALSYLRSDAAAGDGPFGLVFADPPYSSSGRLAEPLSRLLGAVLSSDSIIVTESDKRSPLALDLPLVRERTYGDTLIALHRGQ